MALQQPCHPMLPQPHGIQGVRAPMQQGLHLQPQQQSHFRLSPRASASSASRNPVPLPSPTIGRKRDSLLLLHSPSRSADRADGTKCPKLFVGSVAGNVSEDEVEATLSTIKWDRNGLIVAIAQHIDTGAILMQGFANRDAVSATIVSGRATFYSRSRSALWTKGETSSNFINVIDMFLDCDRDSIIYLGKPDGPTCHTGAETCYFTPARDVGKDIQATSKSYASTTLYSLEKTIGKRKDEVEGNSMSASLKPSWTHKLLQNHDLLCSKIREEADELCRTLEDNEGKNRTASEMADVLYHAMVLLALQDVKLEDVLKILRARFSQSGIEEKNSRR